MDETPSPANQMPSTTDPSLANDFNTQFDARINEYASGNQFGVSMVPAHTHNGTDSLLISPKDLHVAQLSDISPNLGTITSGSLSGVTIDNFTASDLNATTTKVKAGEDLVAGDAVCVLNDLTQTLTGDDLSMGNDASTTRQALRILPRETVTSGAINLLIKKFNTPTDNVTIEVQTDSGGSPSGTPIANGVSNNVAGGTITSSYTLVTFAFASDFTLTSGTTYWLVVKRSTSPDAVNYYILDVSTGSTTSYASFLGKTYNGSAWVATNRVFYVQVVLSSGTPSITAWLTNTDVPPLSLFFGIANGTYAAGATPTLTIDDVCPNMSGLTKGTQYYISNSPGALDIVPASASRGPVGIALSDTDLLLYPQQTAFDNGTAQRTSADGTGLQVISHSLNVIPRFVVITCPGLRSTSFAIMSQGIASSVSKQSSVGLVSVATGFFSYTNTSSIISLQVSGPTNHGEAALSDLTANDFTLNWTTAITSGDSAATFQWAVYG